MGEALTQVPGVLHIDGTPGQVIIAYHAEPGPAWPIVVSWYSTRGGTSA
jgi:hypothetical protein